MAGYVFGIWICVVLHLLATALEVVGQSTTTVTRTTAATIFDVTRKSEASSPGSGGVTQSWSRTLVPVGTVSDGSSTIYSEEVVQYGISSGSSGAASTFSASSYRVARIQGESGYVRIQPGTHSGEGFASSQTCSFLPGGQAGCVDVVHVVQTSSTQLQGGSNSVITSLVPSTSTLSAGEATLVAVATLEATITATSTIPPTNESLPGLADESGSKNNIVGPAVGGSLGGLALILLILAVYWFCKRRKRQHSTRSQTGSRGLIGGGLRGGNNGGHTVLDGGESEYKYHYRTSRMAVTSPEKDALSINSSSASYTNSNYQTHYATSPTHSPSHSYIGSLPAPALPFRASHPPTSPLSTLPVRSEEVESLAPESTIDTIVSQPTMVAQPVRQNTAESTVSSASHPGHGFRIHPSRFIERLSLSSTYLESLTAGGLLVGGRGGHSRETMEQEVEGEGVVISDEPVQNGESVAGHSHSSAPTHPPTSHPHLYRPTSPPSPSPPPSIRSFAPPTQPRFPHPTHSSSTSSLPLPSTSRTVDPPPHLHSPRQTPSTPSFPQSATPRSWVSPSPFSYQSFQTASEGLGDDDTSTIEQEHRQTPESQTQYGFAV
ncbi:hypothetical protein PM082_017878 [Marasmius tenuissimus]|nr:hypothetical protein PM082_017878 [Marasmius tenuissimus]